MTVLYVSRHCATEWNAQGRLQGSHDLPLSRNGLDEARTAAARLRTLSIDRIVSSPLLRARQTAAVYAEFLGLPVSTDEGLRELDHGDWEGSKLGELTREARTGFRAWMDNPNSEPIPNGSETVGEAQRRIAGAMLRTLERPASGATLVVSHKHIIALLRCQLFGVGMDAFRSHILDQVAPWRVCETMIERLQVPA